MRKHMRATWLLIPVLGATLFARFPAPVAAADEEVDVIVNKSNTVADLPLAEAKRIFMCDKTSWPNGKRITVLMLSTGQPERDVVLHEIYKLSESDYGKYFADGIFTGKVAAQPRDLGSASQMKQEVAGNAGAVGYVKSADVDDTVKVVLKLTK